MLFVYLMLTWFGMDKVPESTVPADTLWELVNATGKPHVLKHAIDFKIFDQLSASISAEEVAGKLGTKIEPTSRLLDMLTILGIVTKKAGMYTNTPPAEEYLASGKPTYMGDLYAMTVGMQEGMIAAIPGVLKSGIPEIDVNAAYPEDYWAQMTEMNSRYQRAMWSHKAIPMVIAMPEFPHFRRMLDLAGNAGVFAAALVTRNPALTAVVLDQPPVVEVAKKIIKEYGLEDRIKTLGADFTKDDFGAGYDLVWMSYCLNLAADHLESIFEKVYESIAPGGICVSQHPVVNEAGTWPHDAAWWAHTYAMAGQDMSLPERAISDAMLGAGFGSVESRYVEDCMGVDRVDIARK